MYWLWLWLFRIEYGIVLMMIPRLSPKEFEMLSQCQFSFDDVMYPLYEYGLEVMYFLQIGIGG
jgi:hypothetical protein